MLMKCKFLFKYLQTGSQVAEITRLFYRCAKMRGEQVKKNRRVNYGITGRAV
ncbi:hypothetical protein HMPREF0201_04882 [Cedecea davisae DSM 4568]|uniref:Uncharacterized protein n=1 Tax=Cedecea davisae DSM 4568 TaxID=566551 RepID=S3IGX7_9ENTR|nr:hypothetical protein HMPREF0201_04882 [Cedecea davisae DSM 4568]